jgi:hypothetical protein
MAKRKKQADIEAGDDFIVTIDEEVLEEDKKLVVKNISKSVHSVYGFNVKPGAIYELTEANISDQRGTAKLEMSIKTGYLAWL